MLVSGCRGEHSADLPAAAIPLGRAADFPVGETVRTVERLVVVRDGAGFGAMSLRCTHQECLVAYGGPGAPLECPCHGSLFSPAGAVLQGPATAPLPWYETNVTAAGVLEVTIGKIVSPAQRTPWRG